MNLRVELVHDLLHHVGHAAHTRVAEVFQLEVIHAGPVAIRVHRLETNPDVATLGIHKIHRYGTRLGNSGRILCSAHVSTAVLQRMRLCAHFQAVDDGIEIHACRGHFPVGLPISDGCRAQAVFSGRHGAQRLVDVKRVAQIPPIA